MTRDAQAVERRARVVVFAAGAARDRVDTGFFAAGERVLIDLVAAAGARLRVVAGFIVVALATRDAGARVVAAAVRFAGARVWRALCCSMALRPVVERLALAGLDRDRAAPGFFDGAAVGLMTDELTLRGRLLVGDPPMVTHDVAIDPGPWGLFQFGIEIHGVIENVTRWQMHLSDNDSGDTVVLTNADIPVISREMVVCAVIWAYIDLRLMAGKGINDNATEEE